MRNHRIVVGVDGSPGARSALLWAADEARVRGADLLVVHAADPTDVAVVQAAEAGLRAVDQCADLLLHAQATLASARQPGVPVSMLRSDAGAADALIDQSHEADLVVVGTRGRGGITLSLLGSVSHRVAAHARCPVAVVPQQPVLSIADDDGRPRIVVGVSAAPAGRAALAFAIDEARHRGATVHAVCAQVISHPDADLAELKDQAGDVTLETTVVDAEPAEALIRASRDAQLVVVGCHHSDDRWSTRLGPIPVAILHRTDCPVVVVGTAHRPAFRTHPGVVTTRTSVATGPRAV